MRNAGHFGKIFSALRALTFATADASAPLSAVPPGLGFFAAFVATIRPSVSDWKGERFEDLAHQGGSENFFRAPSVNFRHSRCKCSSFGRPSGTWFLCCIRCYHKSVLIGLEKERGSKIWLRNGRTESRHAFGVLHSDYFDYFCPDPNKNPSHGSVREKAATNNQQDVLP